MNHETDNGIRFNDVEIIWARNSKEFLFSNSVLIHGADPVLVDPSASFTYISSLAEAHYVKTVLNTHFHGDHRSLNQLFKGAYFASHAADADAISEFKHYAKMVVDDDTAFYFDWIKQVFAKYHIVDCPVSIKLKDGDVLDTGSEKINIIHIPGHTPGHIALYFEKADLLYTSDIDLTPYGPWYANPCSDIEQFKQSIRKIKLISCKHYVTSHAERVYDHETFLNKLDRYYLAFETRRFKIIEILKTSPMEMHELCSHGIVYKRAALTDPLKAFFQFKMVAKHLKQLMDEGVVGQDGAKYICV
ncbi:MAG: MBL fold metallo-hydrolase [Deltaproteobacteria bacterium]|nr:MBL fold metallo-hydrolase [Deltaproteobacteria bacterium]